MAELLVGGMSRRRPMSYEAFLVLGETKHHEYYDGLCVVNPPTRRHARVVMHLQSALAAVCPESYEVLSGWGWETSTPELFEPDVMVVARSEGDVDVLRDPPPLLVVEVSSPSTKSDDRGKKRRAYGAAGAQWYWIVDLELAEILVLRNEDGTFNEAQRLTEPGVTPAPLRVELDPKTLSWL